MSQHPNASPSALAGALLATVGELLHVTTRLTQISRDLVESTALQTGDVQLRQQIDAMVDRIAAQAQTDTAALGALPSSRGERRSMVLELYATTDLPLVTIARRAGVDVGTPKKILRKARAEGDRQAAQGDLRRQTAADQAAPLPYSARSPHDGLPESAGNASPDQPVEEGATQDPAQGEEVVPASRAGEELTTSDDPAPASEFEPEEGLRGGPLDLIFVNDPSTQMELADELTDEPAPVSTRRNEEQIERIAAAAERVAAKAQPKPRATPAGLARRVAPKVERAPEPAAPPAPVIRAVVPTESEVGLPILLVDRKAKTVTGPTGVWGGCSSIVLDVCERLADGRLYGHPLIQGIAKVAREETFGLMLARWKSELKAIGVEVYDGKGYGIRLQRQEPV